jgi:hypothetical protein
VLRHERFPMPGQDVGNVIPNVTRGSKHDPDRSPAIALRPKQLVSLLAEGLDQFQKSILNPQASHGMAG